MRMQLHLDTPVSANLVLASLPQKKILMAERERLVREANRFLGPILAGSAHRPSLFLAILQIFIGANQLTLQPE